MDPRGGGGPPPLPIPGPGAPGGGVLCACFRLTGDRLRGAIRRGRLRTVADVAGATGACRGCRTCEPDVERILRSEAAPRGR